MVGDAKKRLGGWGGGKKRTGKRRRPKRKKMNTVGDTQRDQSVSQSEEDSEDKVGTMITQ